MVYFLHDAFSLILLVRRKNVRIQSRAQDRSLEHQLPLPFLVTCHHHTSESVQ